MSGVRLKTAIWMERWHGAGPIHLNINDDKENNAMDFTEAVKTCLTQKYVDFNGRASRPEFWWFFLFQMGVFIVTGLVHQLVYALAVLALLLPGLGVAVRRMHDTGKSGWWLLLSLIPLIGLVVIYFLAQRGNEGANDFGAAPSAGPSGSA